MDVPVQLVAEGMRMRLDLMIDVYAREQRIDADTQPRVLIDSHKRGLRNDSHRLPLDDFVAHVDCFAGEERKHGAVHERVQ